MERERYCGDILSESENRVGFNSSDVPKRGVVRCETNGSIDERNAKNVGRISFALKSGLTFNDALVNREA